MILVVTILSKVGQTEKDKYSMIPFICKIKNFFINTNNRLAIARAGGGVGKTSKRGEKAKISNYK